MTSIANRQAFGVLLCLPLLGTPISGAKAAPVANAALCQRMVDHWKQAWTKSDVLQCRPWWEKRVDALGDALTACLAKHQYDTNDNACTKEADAMSHFQFASQAVDSVTFMPRANGVVNSPYSAKAQAEQRTLAQQEEKAKQHWEKHKEAILASLNSGAASATQSVSGNPVRGTAAWCDHINHTPLSSWNEEDHRAWETQCKK